MEDIYDYNFDEEVQEQEIVFNSKSKVPSAELNEKHSMNGDNGYKDSFSFKRRMRPLSPEKRKEMEEIYSVVAVHDYGDEYHLSEEERREKSKFYETFSKLLKCKRKYRKIDEFVKVYRLCLDCLNIVAEQNGVYEKEKFMLLVLNKKIEVNGLNFPKYVGRDRKDINWEYISQFILDYSKDPSELIKKNESSYDDYDDEELEKMLFSPDDLEKLRDAIEHVEDEDEMYPYDENNLRPGQELIIPVAERNETKHLIESIPEVVKTVKEVEKAKRKMRATNSRLNSFVFEMTNEDFEAIAEMDREYGYRTDSDMPEFKGSIMNRKDYMRYLYQLEVHETEQIKVNYHGKMKTIAEIREIELKDALEQDGWNIRNLYHNKEKEKKLKQARKRDKKTEEKLRKKLCEVQNRNKKRYGESGKKSKDIEFDAKKKKKDKKKKKKDKESD